MLCAAIDLGTPAMFATAPRQLSLTLVHAAQAQEATTEFFARKQACYSRFGAQAASVRTHRPAELQHLYMLIARDDGGEMAGGVAIYRRAHDAALPLETAIGAHYAVACTLQRWQEEGCLAELSGLWVEDEWRKSGLSRELMLAAMASTSLLGICHVVGFSHQHVLEFYGTVGLRPHLALGHFDYPDARYRSTVVHGDPVAFATVPADAVGTVRRYFANLRERGRAACVLRHTGTGEV